MLPKFTKFLLLACVATAVNSSSVFAQGGEPPFVIGSKSIALSLGFGVDYGYHTGYGGNVTNLPVFSVSYDQGVFEKVGPGTVGIGGVIAMKTSSYKYVAYNNGSNTNYRDNYTNFIVAVKGTYHLTLLAEKNNKFDPYGGVTMGLRFFNHNSDYNQSYDDYNSVYPVLGVYVGAKYNFTKNFGAFADVGYDYTAIRLGINFDF